jgi:hypothetical protein
MRTYEKARCVVAKCRAYALFWKHFGNGVEFRRTLFMVKAMAEIGNIEEMLKSLGEGDENVLNATVSDQTPILVMVSTAKPKLRLKVCGIRLPPRQVHSGSRYHQGLNTPVCHPRTE